jgi:hypothetical protein
MCSDNSNRSNNICCNFPFNTTFLQIDNIALCTQYVTALCSYSNVLSSVFLALTTRTSHNI